MTTENRALTLSAAAALMLGVMGVVVSLATGSGAILLDGAFNLSFFVTALATLRVVRLLQRPDDHDYPFGYLQFEPMINTVKAALILVVGMVALIDAGVSIHRGGNELSAGLAMAYAALATAVCGLLVMALRRARGRATSPLVEADMENWLVNFAISLGMLAAFGLALFLQRRGLEGAARLVDPVLVGLVVMLTLGVPIRMARRGLLALLQRAPAPDVVATIDGLVRGALSDLPMRALYLRVVQPGRTTYVLVHVLLGEAAADISVARTDELRGSIVSAVAGRYPPAIVDVVFTTVAEFAAPPTGFAADPGPT
jgi:cation diffusion facilitator family transporter